MHKQRRQVAAVITNKNKLSEKGIGFTVETNQEERFDIPHQNTFKDKAIAAKAQTRQAMLWTQDFIATQEYERQ